jgi:hypothetical protein
MVFKHIHLYVSFDKINCEQISTYVLKLTGFDDSVIGGNLNATSAQVMAVAADKRCERKRQRGRAEYTEYVAAALSSTWGES